MQMSAGSDEIASVMKNDLGLGKVTACVRAGSSGWATMRTFTTDRGDTYFAKVSREDASMFAGEAASLRALYRTGTIRVPEVFHTAKLQTVEGSFILMEKLNLQVVWGNSQLGRAIAELHLAPPVLPEAQAGKFGFEVDNTIGSTPQLNGWASNWVDFFRERRLRYQAARTGDPTVIELTDKLCDRLDIFFEDIKDDIRPSLIHGDLWSGNISGCDGEVAIFDPASYYAHSEAEFGMSWCAGFSRTFWEAYHELVPKAPGFEMRKPLYQLYHYMNHYNLFGGGYAGPVMSILADLTKDTGARPTAKYFDL